MPPNYQRFRKVTLIYVALLITWQMLGLLAYARSPHPIVVGAYLLYSLILAGGLLALALRLLWRIFPAWACVLPTLALFCFLAGFAPLLLPNGVLPQVQDAAMHTPAWFYGATFFLILVGGFGMMVAAGLNQTRLRQPASS